MFSGNVSKTTQGIHSENVRVREYSAVLACSYNMETSVDIFASIRKR